MAQEGPRRLLLLAGLGLLVAAVGASLIFDSGPESDTGVDRPVGAFAGHGSEYSSPRELAENSRLIVVGTVTDSRTGEVFDDDPTGRYPTRMLHTVVQVDEALKGSPTAGEVRVTTDELGFAAPNLDDWRKEGTRVLLFLTPSAEEGYVLANLNYTQTAYFIQGEDVRAAVGNPVSAQVAEMSLSDLRRELGNKP